MSSSETDCLSCEIGFYIKRQKGDTTCERCDSLIPYCYSCDKDKCLICNDGSFLVDGKCTPPTNAFSESNYFTCSNDFSQSIIFSSSLNFNHSNIFTHSDGFTKTTQFTESNLFSETSNFSISNEFSDSNYFSFSYFFSNSFQFNETMIFSLSNNFSNSIVFTNSKIFSNSASFTVEVNQINSQSSSINEKFSLSMSYLLTYVLRKSVSYSFSILESNIYFYSYINGQYTLINSQTNVEFYLPYIIQYLSPSYKPEYTKLENVQIKKKITPEQLIGITCGSAAVFFLILAIIIFAINKKYKINDDIDDYSISSDDTNEAINHYETFQFNFI